MDNINLLWELQNHRNTLKNMKSKFLKDGNIKDIENIGKKLNKIEKKLKNLEESIKENKGNLNKKNSLLKDYDYELTTTEKELYGGNITDLQQLKFLDEERENIKKQIDKEELEIIIEMESMENLEVDLMEMEEEFQSLREEYTSLVKDYKALKKEYEDGVRNFEGKVMKLSSIIDEDSLRRYNELAKGMDNPMVEIVNNQCLGCYMLLPTFLVDEVKAHDKIIFCESCGRILYIEEL